MKKFLKKSGKAAFAVALAMCVGGGYLAADPALSINAGFKLPFTLVKFHGLEDGSRTEFLKVNDWPAYDGQDLKFNFHSDSAGIVINFKPFTEWAWDGLTTDADWSNGGDGSKKLKNNPADGLNRFLDEYSAWFAFGRDKNWRVDMGTSEERHWYKGVEERVNNKPGEIGIIDCDDDKNVGVYYGLMGKTNGSENWNNKGSGNISYSQEYGFDSSVIGGNNHGNGQIIDSFRVSYSQGESGLFATAALLQQNGKEFCYNDKTDGNSIDWISGFGVRVGYAFDSIGSFEVIYKTLEMGNNVFALFYQPRFLDGALLGTVGLTGVVDVRDGSAKYGGVANEMGAFAVDLRLQYNPTDKLKLFLYGNFSMVKPGDNNTAGWAHYTGKNGKVIDNKPELGGYVVAAVGYQLPLGSVNLDVGYFMRDLDNNDGYNYGENFLAVKAGWNLWLGNGAGFGIGGAWYHYCNTGDMSKTANYVKDSVQVGAYFEVWLGN